MTTNKELPKTYDPKTVENKWYQHWEQNQLFKPKAGKVGKAFTIIMPPPNVTGILHMGHALDNTCQDVLTRFKRMKGFEALWIPGQDHAGIATQSVVEKKVYKEEKKTRHDIGREDFLKLIWKWKEENGDMIIDQLKKLGVSCDWDYFTFTMDEGPNRAVRKVFTKLFNEGLIYQSDYIVNWCTELQSAISDAEVDHIETKGAFYHLLYPVKGEDTKLEVATTRPETLLGDTAVAVNPEDERFKHLIGKTAIVPICNREVPIVADEHVALDVGTGCLKVTPGHDFNDFEIGKRHNLPIVNILNKDGTLNSEAGEFEGLTCKKARSKIVGKLKELELFVKEIDHTHSVGHCSRTKTVIEPMVSKQWFLNTSEMAAEAVKSVETERMKFYPKSWENTYFSWLRNPKDWCISRQLWWGHRIPVYTCSDCGNQFASEFEPTECTKCQKTNLVQDPDVLDTWFSSGLWPLSTLGWPNEEVMAQKGFEKFYPNDVLVTGFDIIFFWVARMMMMCQEEKQAPPFEKVYIHGIVRDKQGRKMSKSLGNGINPLDLIDQYGTDAMRFTLAAGSGYNRGLNLDPARIEGYRNFINKLWNAFRFISPSLDTSEGKLPGADQLTHHDRWILSELNTVTKSVNESLEDFRFDDASSALYSFVYDKFCSWYIELSKPVLYGDDQNAKETRVSVLKYTLQKILALIHPITPFITEEIWSYVKEESESEIIVAEYPEYDQALNFQEDQDQMNDFIELVTLIRNLRAGVNLPPKEKISLEVFTDNSELSKYLQSNTVFLDELAKVEKLKVETKFADRPKKSAAGATAHAEIYMPLEGLIDIEEQVSRISKQIEKNQKDLEKFTKKLSNSKFVDNAPSEVVDEVKEKAKLIEDKIKSLKQNLSQFQ